ncbi:MAG: Tetratricopeptide 2 repeat-containing protein [Firmicutes bacterium]|nr:Tetratricopeptide 2 repeat-containing protein [Bacillota bacterium]
MVMLKVDYIAITFLAIVFSIFFAFKILSYVGLDLNIKPLILCALCALAINFFLPIITIHLVEYHFPVILGITMISSYFISRYNTKLTLNRQAMKELLLDEGPSTIIPAEKPSTKDLKSQPPKKTEIKIAEIAKPTNTPILTELKSIGAKPKAKPTTFATVAVAKQTPSSLNIAALAATSAVLDSIQPKQLSNKPPLYLVKTDMLTLTASPKPQVEAKSETKVIDLAKEAKKQKKLAIVKHVAKLEKLDDLLDYALDQRDNNEKDSALYAFKKALKLYQKNDYAPFIVIEIGNIYKNTGLYDDAIVIYNKALKLPSLIHNDELRQEFINNIAYLRIVKNALLRRNISRTPFKDISQKIFSEIETEFQIWRTQNL